MKPTAFITGYKQGYPMIKLIDPALVLPVGMALYSYENVLNAVKTERESCASQASDLAEIGYDGRAIAVAIRARGEVK